MNSVIQQLLLIPGVKETLLAIDDEESDEDTLFFQFQMVMGHLQVSRHPSFGFIIIEVTCNLFLKTNSLPRYAGF